MLLIAAEIPELGAEFRFPVDQHHLEEFSWLLARNSRMWFMLFSRDWDSLIHRWHFTKALTVDEHGRREPFLLKLEQDIKPIVCCWAPEKTILTKLLLVEFTQPILPTAERIGTAFQEAMQIITALQTSIKPPVSTSLVLTVECTVANGDNRPF